MMKAEVLLDWEGTASVPDGYRRVSSEVDFLKHATDDCPLVICGERLCLWAETYYRGRGRPVRDVPKDLSVRLRETFPGLTENQARTLAERLGGEAPSPITTTAVLDGLYPESADLWHQPPCRAHAARWLIWLQRHQPDDAEQVILQHHARDHWSCITAPERRAYEALNRDAALECLDAWLGLRPDDPWKVLGEFPIPLPDELIVRLRQEWRRRIIDSDGECFGQLLWWPLPPTLRQLAASETAAFFVQHPDRITPARLQHLRPYLTAEDLASVEASMTPPEPQPVPETPDDVISWFEKEYLPFRRWQDRTGNPEAATQVRCRARDFALWYLRHYPEWGRHAAMSVLPPYEPSGWRRCGRSCAGGGPGRSGGVGRSDPAAVSDISYRTTDAHP
jgi:hypothetical protein